MPEEKPIGDEVSSATAAIHRLHEEAYDLFTRKKYEEAYDLFEQIASETQKARRALRVLGAEVWAATA